MTEQVTFHPCTQHGIVELVKETNLDISGNPVVVIGRSKSVVNPVGQLFLNENATVTYFHSKTQNMKDLSKLADILIVAVGRLKMI
ncbi:bifunctional methylenetetrahydrofolate dehydrogenase/methenyltetrahydrofolate cyclohydrolase, partial [Bacillus thuringiensis]|nr:bifunctional methylenetetrahydrofolate dehydrogenase/methenyltetrahydrofolate cyclohydrolase [Bacillus thuringiensis]